MITFFNKLGNSWVAKIILGILAVSMMAFWGLGGLTNLNSYNNEAISIGKVSISTQYLANAFETERKNISRQIGGKYISPAQALELGLLQKVIQEEIIKQVKLQIKEDLGLTASNESVQKYVESNPVFKDALGNFDKNYFYAFLSQKGLTETMLAHQLKDELAYNHLKDTLQGLSYTSPETSKLSYLFKNEKRDIQALFIKPSDLNITEKPSDEDLMNYYEAYSENFMKPEYRTIKLLSITPDMMEQFITLNDADINSLYEEEKTKYDTPEERELLQIFFKTHEEALKAKGSLTTQNFEEKALSLGQTKESTYFGYTPKNQLMEDLQEPVFKTAKGSITEPISSQTGWHIFYVKDIKKATTANPETVKAEIKKSLIANQAYDKLLDVTRKIEDLLGSGTSLTDTAKTLNLTVLNLDGLDIAGINKKGEKNTLITPTLMQEVFTLNKNDTTSLIENGNGYLIAEIVEIEPVGTKKFDEVKQEVINLYISEKQKEKFPKITEQIFEKAKTGTALSSLANTYNAKFISENSLERETDSPLFKAITSKIFAQNIGAKNAELIITPDNQGAVISVVTNVYTPTADLSTADFKAVELSEKQYVGEILNEALFNDYMKKLNVKVNQKAVNQIISLYKGQE